MTKENKRNALNHVLIWAIYWGIELSILYFSTGQIYAKESIPNGIFNMILFYIILYYILPQKNTEIIYSNIVLKMLILLLIYLFIKTTYMFFLNQFSIIKIRDFKSYKEFYITQTYRFLLFSIYAGFIWFFTTKNKLSKILLEKQLQEERLKNSLLLAQQSALKAKINPHFLFNTLSFLYAKSVISSDEVVSKTILLLSDVFRYSLKNDLENQKVRINDEVDHIKRLIEINKLRFNNKFYFNVTNIGEEQNKLIPPFILLTLFENALKHGDFQNPETPISFYIEQSFNKIIIQTSNTNKKIVINEMESFNIGLKYIESVLENFYKKNCTLQIENLNETHTLELMIITND